MFTIWPASTVFRSALRLHRRQFTPRSFPFHGRRVEPRLQFSRLPGPLLCSRKIPDRGIESLGQRIAFLERGGGGPATEPPSSRQCAKGNHKSKYPRENVSHSCLIM